MSIPNANAPAEVPSIKPDDFRVGRSDNAGETIVRIYYKTRNTVVYRTKKSIHLDVDEDFEGSGQLLANHANIYPELARVYSLLPENLTWVEAINRQIARSIAQNLKGHTVEAKQMLQHAEERIRRLKVINGRLQYAISSLAVAVAAVVGLIVSSALAKANAETFTTEIIPYWHIAGFAAMGGFLSVALGFRNLDIDVDANWFTNCLVGASRILIAILAAVFAFLLVRSGVVLNILSHTDKSSEYGWYALAMAAGFSERLVPNIMDNLGGPPGAPHAETEP
jgi:hypothetical protein